jgi:hypothetical protein
MGKVNNIGGKKSTHSHLIDAVNRLMLQISFNVRYLRVGAYAPALFFLFPPKLYGGDIY